MFENLLYIFFALLGIGFLIFIHELGHYWMARRVGITVEVFAIGFGKAIYEWEHKGVKWKLCWLPFGGYVKMAGTEKKGSIEPYQIPNGYFSKRPWDRIKVAAIGPLSNLLFALLAFALLWIVGGRLKPFREFTRYIGWVDENSGLYQQGVRPGDLIEKFNGRPFKGFQDLFYGTFLEDRVPALSGQEIDYFTGERRPFHYTFNSENTRKGSERAFLTTRTLGPSDYLLYNRLPGNRSNPLPEGSPLKESGLSYGDRLLWIDGVLLFSSRQLVEVLNAPKVLLTVQRGEEIFLTRIPRLKIADLRLSASEIEELDDWRYEAEIESKTSDLYFIPYNLTSQAIVESPFAYVDERSKVQSIFNQPARSMIEFSLLRGDRILAVDGIAVQSAYDLLKELQTRHIQIIVQRAPLRSVSWKEADAQFARSYDLAALKKIADSIGTSAPVTSWGNVHLLRSVTPVHAKDLPLFPKERMQQEKRIAKQQKAIESLKDPKQREEALQELERQEKRFMLGVVLQDQLVQYNPSPFALFVEIIRDTGRTLHALITGYLSPKNIMGPIGIVEVIQTSWTYGVKEVLFWLGMISLNLGLFNLLPIPVLDGGHILFSIVESVTKKPLRAKTMERIFLFFTILLISFMIYITFHDISRLFR